LSPYAHAMMIFVKGKSQLKDYTNYVTKRLNWGEEYFRHAIRHPFQHLDAQLSWPEH